MVASPPRTRPSADGLTSPQTLIFTLQHNRHFKEVAVDVELKLASVEIAIDFAIANPGPIRPCAVIRRLA